MPTIQDTAATSALNEKEYINKIYGSIGASQKDTLKQNYDDSIRQLNAGQQAAQNITNGYLNRTNVESARNQADYASAPAGGGKANLGGSAQAQLSMGNQRSANATALAQRQSEADQEFERQRKLLGEAYSTQIKQAAANNDMAKAQALYEAAKAEEAQLRSLRNSAAALMASKGDQSIYDAIAAGAPVTPDTTTPTWEGVTKNDAAIHEIYDKQMEAQRLAAQQERDAALSDIDARQQASQRQTDKNLTNAYVKALRAGKNYTETQTAYGQGSGVSAQARLARGNELTRDLTNLRTLQLGQDASYEQKRLDAIRAYGAKRFQGQQESDLARVKALYSAAEAEEQNRVADQLLVGQARAKNGDYYTLGKLYGLTDAQLLALMPQASGGGDDEGYGYGGSAPSTGKLTDALRGAALGAIGSTARKPQARQPQSSGKITGAALAGLRAAF